MTGPGGTLRAATYSYDANDNRLTETLSPAGLPGSGSQSFGYDRADRLTNWTSPANVTTSYGWDGAGNRTSAGGTAATFDERNRLTSDGTATYTYTARGTGRPAPPAVLPRPPRLTGLIGWCRTVRRGRRRTGMTGGIGSRSVTAPRWVMRGWRRSRSAMVRRRMPGIRMGI